MEIKPVEIIKQWVTHARGNIAVTADSTAQPYRTDKLEISREQKRATDI